jgi:hypothetical protein
MERLAKLAGHFGHRQQTAAALQAPPPPAAAWPVAAAGGAHQLLQARQRAGGERHVLVVGGTGLIGRACAERFAAAPGWHVTTVSRRALPFPLPGDHHSHLELDLSDRAACSAGIRGLAAPPVSHVVYTAMGTTAADAGAHEAINVGDEAGRALNSAMFGNLLDALEECREVCGGGLHIQLMQGRLAYGGWAVPAVRFPSREERPDRSPSWFFEQEDELRTRLHSHPHWTATSESYSLEGMHCSRDNPSG